MLLEYEYETRTLETVNVRSCDQTVSYKPNGDGFPYMCIALLTIETRSHDITYLLLKVVLSFKTCLNGTKL